MMGRFTKLWGSACAHFVRAWSSANLHEKITQFSLAEKGVQFSCNTSANYKWFPIGWKNKKKQGEPIRLELF